MLGRPIPCSSSDFTSAASVKRGGGWVKCCSGRSLTQIETFSDGQCGKRRLIELVLIAAFILTVTVHGEESGKRMTEPVARKVYGAIATGFDHGAESRR